MGQEPSYRIYESPITHHPSPVLRAQADLAAAKALWPAACVEHQRAVFGHAARPAALAAREPFRDDVAVGGKAGRFGEAQGEAKAQERSKPRGGGMQQRRQRPEEQRERVDRARAESIGMSPGGDIMIHGLRNGRGATGAFHRTVDWTDGCIALTDEEIEGMWSAVMVGTPVEIKP